MAGFGGLVQLADKRAFDTAYDIATDKNRDLSFRTAALTVVGATGKGNPKAYPAIDEAFKRAVAGNSLQAMLNSLEAFIKIADPRGQSAFDTLKEKYKNSGLGTLIQQYEDEFHKAMK